MTVHLITETRTNGAVVTACKLSGVMTDKFRAVKPENPVQAPTCKLCKSAANRIKKTANNIVDKYHR